MFRWSDNPSGTPVAKRRLWVEKSDGDRSLVRFGSLERVLGEAERRRLVRVAIKRGSARWHLATAKAVAVPFEAEEVEAA